MSLEPNQEEANYWRNKFEHLERSNAELAARLEEVEKVVSEFREIKGCIDWGAVNAGRATVLSEVQRTVQELRAAQHARGQERIKHEMERDTLTAKLAAAVEALKAVYENPRLEAIINRYAPGAWEELTAALKLTQA